jgi:hypothetical protein
MWETGAGKMIMLRKCSDVSLRTRLVFGIYIEAFTSFTCLNESHSTPSVLGDCIFMD